MEPAKFNKNDRVRILDCEAIDEPFRGQEGIVLLPAKETIYWRQPGSSSRTEDPAWIYQVHVNGVAGIATVVENCLEAA